MNTYLQLTALALGLFTAPLLATASDFKGDCTSTPQAGWQTPQNIQARFERFGYSVKKVEQEGTCYEVKARDNQRRKLSFYVDPATGKFFNIAVKD